MTSTLQRGRRATQRERLLAGMVRAANRDGYARANVTSVIAEAGVSRPTFYDYFADKDDCFLAALADAQLRLLGDVRVAVEGERPSARCSRPSARSSPSRARSRRPRGF